MKTTTSAGQLRPHVTQARPLALLLATLTVALAAGYSQTAAAQGMGAPHGEGHHGRGGPHAGGPEGHRHAGADMMRMLDRVNATAEQRSQIKTIMDAARKDLQATHEAGRGLHQQMQAAFAQANVDARAVEALRQQIQAQHETASKRMTQARLDAAKVLTPEQRKSLAEMAGQRKAMHERHRAERAGLDKPAGK